MESPMAMLVIGDPSLQDFLETMRVAFAEWWQLKKRRQAAALQEERPASEGGPY